MIARSCSTDPNHSCSLHSRRGRITGMLAVFLLSILASLACTSTDEAGSGEADGLPVSEDGTAPAEGAAAEDEKFGEDPAAKGEDFPGELTDDAPKADPTDEAIGDSTPSSEPPVPPVEDAPAEMFGDSQPDTSGDDMVTTPALPEDSAVDTEPEPATAKAGKGKSTRYVSPALLNVRSKPSLKAPVVRRLLGGAKIHVEVRGGWSKIKDGQWVRTKHLSAKPTRKVSRTEVDKLWKNSKYKDKWKPTP